LFGAIFNDVAIANFAKKRANERMFKIGRYMAKIWTKVSWHPFMANGVFVVLFSNKYMMMMMMLTMTLVYSLTVSYS